MNIVHYPTWSGQHALQQQMKKTIGRLFDNAADGESAAAQWPRVDIKEEPQRFVIYADLPGIDPHDIDVQMDKGILSIKGERRGGSGDETERFSRIERRYGSFQRRFALPDSADSDAISAHGHNGVLEISIPKKPETTPRRIQVAMPAR